MKIIFSSIINFLTILLLFSCTKHDNKELLNRINDEIRGQYKCVSITFLGTPLDLNGDGNTNNNLLKEMSDNLSKSIVNGLLRIYPATDYEKKELIYLEIPMMQYIFFDTKQNKYYTVKGCQEKGAGIDISYSIGKDGKISFFIDNTSNTNLSKKDDNIIKGVNYLYLKGITMEKPESGKLNAEIECMYYDYATAKTVIGKTLFQYERVSYAL